MVDKELPVKISAEDKELTEAIPVQVNPQYSSNIYNLLMSWQGHVARIRSELDLPDSDTSIWGVHDLKATLIIRDFNERPLGLIESSTREKVEAILSEIDQLFRSYTEEDPRNMIDYIDSDEPDPGRGWWWNRIPVRGPIRRELDVIYGRFQRRI
ncbi:hypothetical protein CLV72_110170 [Allonocardiopsis opalescens]|uniref:Uncharacterized protein n=1 Tax=Allonocardiopsis opalescens TaxID=1144618 RepID=A0A2T0PU31_9ACTN|nr:hypothetical protein CLV72_110170 [Allonocardiopsis opalescens]